MQLGLALYAVTMALLVALVLVQWLIGGTHAADARRLFRLGALQQAIIGALAMSVLLNVALQLGWLVATPCA